MLHCILGDWRWSMFYDSLAECAWVAPPLPGTLDNDLSFGHGDPADGHARVQTGPWCSTTTL